MIRMTSIAAAATGLALAAFAARPGIAAELIYGNWTPAQEYQNRVVMPELFRTTPSPEGERAGVRGLQMLRLDRVQDFLEHTSVFSKHVVIPKSQYEVPRGLQQLAPSGIVLPILIVLPAIISTMSFASAQTKSTSIDRSALAA